MDALIMSCSTGGGHNAAAAAIKEELERRGHHAVMLDPYILTGRDLDKKVGDGYVKLVQRSPQLFGVAYRLGGWDPMLPIHSPVYQINKAMCNKMQEYLAEHHYDVVFMPHIYPAEILTIMKNRGLPTPKMIFIATDYVCIPFTEEVDCDYYVTPGVGLNADFIRRGIPAERLRPCGIPVRREFLEQMSREEAIDALGLDRKLHYILLSGGSIGVGQTGKELGTILRYISGRKNYRLIVICGSNRRLYRDLEKQYGEDPRLILLGVTREMAKYMRACDVLISKPGGLSSTEAAVSGTPLIHISPIPGCETKNVEYFAQLGMCIPAADGGDSLYEALVQLEDPAVVKKMKQNQKKYIPAEAAAAICDLAENS